MTTHSGSEQRPDPDQTPEGSANSMDRPLPGSDGPVPNATASGVAEPIEATERASDVSPGKPSPLEQAQAKPEAKPTPQSDRG